MSTVSYRCRFCLKQMQPNEKMAFIDDEIKEQFLNVTQIMLELHNGLSQIVCEICLRSIQLSHAMKIQFVENQRKLLSEIRSVAQPNASKDLSIAPRPIDKISKYSYNDPEPPNKKRKISIQEPFIKIKAEKIDPNYNDNGINQEENDSDNSDDSLNIHEKMELKISPSDLLDEISVSDTNFQAEESFAEDDNSQEHEQYNNYDRPNTMEDIKPGKMLQSLLTTQKQAGPTTCIYCGKLYKNKKNMRRHVIEEHKKVKFFCVVPGCTASCTRKAQLRSHVNAKHNNLGPTELAIMLEKVSECRPVYESEL